MKYYKKVYFNKFTYKIIFDNKLLNMDECAIVHSNCLPIYIYYISGPDGHDNNVSI